MLVWLDLHGSSLGNFNLHKMCQLELELKKERQSRFPPTLTPTLTQLHISSHHTTPHLHTPISHFYTTPLSVLIDWLAAVRFSMIFCLFLFLQVNHWQASQSPLRCGKQSKMGWGLPNTMSVYQGIWIFTSSAIQFSQIGTWFKKKSFNGFNSLFPLLIKNKRVKTIWCWDDLDSKWVSPAITIWTIQLNIDFLSIVRVLNCEM